MSENLNIGATVEAWADITVKEWQARINALNIGDTGALYESFNHDVVGNESIEKVRFTFKDYGIYVNYGVGREISRGNQGDLGFKPIRAPKRWFSSIIYRETQQLSRILAEKYGMNGANTIIQGIRENLQSGADSLISDKTNRNRK